jgi:hypothetical protein
VKLSLLIPIDPPELFYRDHIQCNIFFLERIRCMLITSTVGYVATSEIVAPRRLQPLLWTTYDKGQRWGSAEI